MLITQVDYAKNNVGQFHLDRLKATFDLQAALGQLHKPLCFELVLATYISSAFSLLVFGFSLGVTMQIITQVTQPVFGTGTRCVCVMRTEVINTLTRSLEFGQEHFPVVFVLILNTNWQGDNQLIYQKKSIEVF